MANGDADDLAGVHFGFRGERYFPRGKDFGNARTWLPCIHWRLSSDLAVRLVSLATGGVYLTLHNILNQRIYDEDPRIALSSGGLLYEVKMATVDPLAIVSIVEEWSKKEPLKVVEHPEAAMLSLPS